MTGRLSVKHEECVESLIAEKYILGELSEVECERFEEHFFSCTDCAHAVRSLSHLKDGSQVVLAHQPAYVQTQSESSPRQPNRLQQWWASWLRPQAVFSGALAALAVAVVTSYQNVQLRTQLRPQVVHSVLLQPVTRGEFPAASSASEAGLIVLEADLPAASGELSWSLRASDGNVAVHGTGPAPEPGLSFKVMIPATQLKATDYTLTVRSDTGKEWVFPFRRGHS